MGEISGKMNISKFHAALTLILLSPLMLTIAAISVLVQGLPILFYQKRIGYEYSPFLIIKFRTMKNDNIENKLITEQNDSRITTWGHFLRKTKLDELPQLYNVFKGDMSFVGPRPEVRKYFQVGDFSFLENIKPGITDYASIIFRNETEILGLAGGAHLYPELLKIKLDLANLYASNKNSLHDFQVITVTMISLVFPYFAARHVLQRWIIPKDNNLGESIQKWCNRY